MKTILLLISALAATTSLLAQNQIFSKFTKTDGTTIKGTSTRKLFENQVIVTNYTGGSDNSAIIEIEAPTSACIAEFRNVMNAASTANTTPVAKPIATANTAIATAKPELVAAKPGLITSKIALPTKQPGIARVEVTVLSPAGAEDYTPKPSRQIILEDVKVLSCTDNPSTNTTKIKLQGSRIGWIYYSYSPKGVAGPITKSGWDAVGNKAWSGF